MMRNDSARGRGVKIVTGLEELPTRSFVRSQLRGGRVRFRRPVIGMYLVGSRARLDREHRADSDVDIALVIAPVRGKTSLRVSENFHARYGSDAAKPAHEGKRVDFQFFYPGEIEAEGYSAIELPEGR
jgi:predicted nucleotidyltransferase